MSKEHRKTRNVISGTKRLEKRQKLYVEELLFQPWFLPKRAAISIRWLVPPDYRRRMHDYFDDYGCMRCSRLDAPYKSNGMCRACVETVFGRLRSCATRRLNQRLPRRYGKEFIAKARLARKLLRGLSHHVTAGSKHPRIKSVQLGNPVIDTFDGFQE